MPLTVVEGAGSKDPTARVRWVLSRTCLGMWALLSASLSSLRVWEPPLQGSERGSSAHPRKMGRLGVCPQEGLQGQQDARRDAVYEWSGAPLWVSPSPCSVGLLGSSPALLP